MVRTGSRERSERGRGGAPDSEPNPRRTRQRDAIEGVFREAGRPLSPVEVLATAKSRVPAMSLATVYRTIRRLEAERLLAPVELPGCSPRYEMARPCDGCDESHGKAHAHEHHHHHFHCQTCDRVYDIPGCPGPLRELAPAGFEVRSHDITLYGRCESCASGRDAARRKPRRRA